MRFQLRWLGSRVGIDTFSKTFSYSLFTVKVLERPFTSTKEKRKKKPKTKPSSGVSLEQIISDSRSALYVLKHLRLKVFKATAIIASDDPALTGEFYGYLTIVSSALNALFPKASFKVGADFYAENPRGQLESSVSIRIIHLLIAGWQIAKARFKERRNRRRLNSAIRKERMYATSGTA